MEKVVVRARAINRGVAEGEAMVTRQPFGFSHGLETATGRISDSGHEWLGQNLKGKVIVFPYGKGSVTGGLYILEAAKQGNTPAAVINLETDPVVAGGFIMADLLYGKETPVVDRPERDPVEIIRNGDLVKVDGNNGTFEVYRRQSA
ncbi:MAG: DUF126 domain-containing protein [Chloroflexi bacterium]|nr:DUF126 domain-containing protein [Chloroflexota bacterium]